MRAKWVGVVALGAAACAQASALDWTEESPSVTMPAIVASDEFRGATGPASIAVPEPGAVALLGIAAGVATKRRRKD